MEISDAWGEPLSITGEIRGEERHIVLTFVETFFDDREMDTARRFDSKEARDLGLMLMVAADKLDSFDSDSDAA